MKTVSPELAAHLAGAGKLKVAADVNAVPPAGVEGLDAHDDGGALAAPRKGG